jgi:hypothetical protein
MIVWFAAVCPSGQFMTPATPGDYFSFGAFQCSDCGLGCSVCKNETFCAVCVVGAILKSGGFCSRPCAPGKLFVLNFAIF